MKRRGFTLLEMAIVLTLIGLISAAIIIGQDMLRSARLQAAAGQIAHYTRAVDEFHDKYLALPGDFAGATALWGAANPVPAACWTTASSGTATCDGNGDGRITLQGNSCGGSCNTLAAQYEQFRAWQHLADAGLITGGYSGVPGPLGFQDAIPGTNVPAAQLPGAGFNLTSLSYTESLALPQYYFPANYGQIIQFGKRMPSLGGIMADPVLTSAEAQAFDSKLDDGRPGAGKIVSWVGGSVMNPHCATNNNAATATYDSAQSGMQCSLIISLGLGL